MDPTTENSEARQSFWDRAWARVLFFLISYFLINTIMQFITLYGLSLAHAESFYSYITNFQQQISAGQIPLMPMLSIQTAGLAGLFIVLAFFRRRLDRRSITSLGFQWKGWQRDAIIGFLLGILLIGMGFLFLLVSGLLQIESAQWALVSLFLSLIFYLVVALNEEIMLRGYVLNNLLQQYHPYNALGVSALLFAIMHGLNVNITLLGIMNIFLAGVLLGIYYIYRQNLWFPIMLHLSWNFFQGPIFGFEVSGIQSSSLINQTVEGPWYLTGGDFGFEGSILLTLMLLLAIWIVHMRYGAYENRSHKQGEESGAR